MKMNMNQLRDTATRIFAVINKHHDITDNERGNIQKIIALLGLHSLPTTIETLDRMIGRGTLVDNDALKYLHTIATNEASPLLCPLCEENELHPDPAMNPLSRESDQYICNECGREEAIHNLGQV